jgi:hypothetical protein
VSLSTQQQIDDDQGVGKRQHQPDTVTQIRALLTPGSHLITPAFFIRRSFAGSVRTLRYRRIFLAPSLSATT